MNYDNKNRSKESFSLSSKLSEDQKRQIEINLVKSAAERERLNKMVSERNQAIARQKADQEKETRRRSDEQVRKTVKSSPELKPGGAADNRSYEQRIKDARAQIEASLKPVHEKQNDDLSRKHNERIDQEIAGVKAVQASQKLQAHFRRGLK